MALGTTSLICCPHSYRLYFLPILNLYLPFHTQINYILYSTLYIVSNRNGQSWAQQKLCPLNRLNILLSINGPLLSLGFNGLND